MEDEVTISKFKATCLALLAKVKRTGRPILVTRKGEPIAQIIPPPPPKRPESWLGDRKSTRLNSSHTVISYAVFCLKKKKTTSNKSRSPAGLSTPTPSTSEYYPVVS